MSKRSLLLAFSLLVFMAALDLAAQTQTATVTGQITHTDNQPAAGLVVSVGDKFGFTDVRGAYRIRDVPFGRHTMQIKAKDQRVLKEVPLVVGQSVVQCNVRL